MMHPAQARSLPLRFLVPDVNDPSHPTDLERSKSNALAAIAAAGSSSELDDLQVQFLGRKSVISELNAGLASATPDEKKTLGRAINEARVQIQNALLERREGFADAETAEKLALEHIDVTLPGRTIARGAMHPLRQVIDEIVDAFIGIGFRMVEGPIVETDYYNFEALNIPKDHPARSMHDTLYVDRPSGELPLLRTHTSPMQARVMQSQPPPVYVVIPGPCARRDEVDANHLAGFMQIEGLAVDEGISFSDMKGTLEVFAKAIFGPKQTVRMHPSYFPFTEPSAELYVSCFACDGSGCPTCRGEGWIEIMGAGMVHPDVFRRVGYDPEKYTGFAFGMGVERIAKLKYGVHDLRTFYENDLAFLRAFR